MRTRLVALDEVTPAASNREDDNLAGISGLPGQSFRNFHVERRLSGVACVARDDLRVSICLSVCGGEGVWDV